jgi:hypothetical protein
MQLGRSKPCVYFGRLGHAFKIVGVPLSSPNTVWPQISGEGQPLRALYDIDGSHISSISAVTEAGGRLFFGNLAKDYISHIQKPPPIA